MVRRFPDAVTIFIMPPSLAELERRLRQRAADNLQDIDLRLQNARKEIDQRSFCRHELLNDDIGKATQALVVLIEGYRQGVPDRSAENGRGAAK
jgi:guanylate kinase